MKTRWKTVLAAMMAPFVEPLAGASPACNLAAVPDCSEVPFDGTARSVPKKGSFSEPSEKRDDLMRQ
jgi:hypothetical protein